MMLEHSCKFTRTVWTFTTRSLGVVLAIIVFAGGPAEAGTTPGEIAYLGLDATGIWQVWVMAEDGSSARQVTYASQDMVRASWYPDGSRMLINAIDGHAYRLTLADGNRERVDLPLEGSHDAVLSPDGKYIAFSLSTSGSTDANNIWLAREDGTDLEKLVTLPWLQHEPTWDPDSQSIYFLSGAGRQNHDIWRVDRAGGEPKQITANHLYHFDVAARSDGSLVYSNNRDGDYDLWLRQPDGSERRLTVHPGLDARPTWGPEGRRLVFESSRDGGPDLWLLDLDTEDLTRLTHTQGGARFPVWRHKEGQP